MARACFAEGLGCCFYKLGGVLFLGVIIISAVVFGVYIRAPNFLQTPR